MYILHAINIYSRAIQYCSSHAYYFIYSIEWPDPELFKENITVRDIDKGPLKFKMPVVSDIDIGIKKVKEELVSFPPFADLKDLLQPM